MSAAKQEAPAVPRHLCHLSSWQCKALAGDEVCRQLESGILYPKVSMDLSFSGKNTNSGGFGWDLVVLLAVTFKRKECRVLCLSSPEKLMPGSDGHC